MGNAFEDGREEERNAWQGVVAGKVALAVYDQYGLRVLPGYSHGHLTELHGWCLRGCVCRGPLRVLIGCDDVVGRG